VRKWGTNKTQDGSLRKGEKRTEVVIRARLRKSKNQKAISTQSEEKKWHDKNWRLKSSSRGEATDRETCGKKRQEEKTERHRRGREKRKKKGTTPRGKEEKFGNSWEN